MRFAQFRVLNRNVKFVLIAFHSTVRLWDVNDNGKKQRHVLKPRSQQGRRVIPTTCTYSHNGNWIVCACQDGSLQMWDHRKSFVCDIWRILHECLRITLTVTKQALVLNCTGRRPTNYCHGIVFVIGACIHLSVCGSINFFVKNFSEIMDWIFTNFTVLFLR